MACASCLLKGKPIALAETTESVQGSGANRTSRPSLVAALPALVAGFAFWTLLLAGAAHSTTHNSPAVHRLQTGCDSRTTSPISQFGLTRQLQITTRNYMDVLPTSIRLPPEIKNALQRRATAEDRSLASYILRVLKAHVEDTPEPKPTKLRK
jgi:hypothetical protein